MLQDFTVLLEFFFFFFQLFLLPQEVEPSTILECLQYFCWGRPPGGLDRVFGGSGLFPHLAGWDQFQGICFPAIARRPGISSCKFTR